MAHIHGKAGSTRYLIAGMDPLNGKRPETLSGIEHFYTHYKEILAGTKASVSQREDEKIGACTREETRLEAVLKAGIAWQTIVVDKALRDLDAERSGASGFFSRARLHVRYWCAVALRHSRIHGPYAGLSRELEGVRSHKLQLLKERHTVVDAECRPILRSYHFLEAHLSFLTGAQGEEYVIEALTRLPDEYHVINGIQLRFTRALSWRKYNECIRACRIDHIVAGPTGIFLLETKNWKKRFDAGAGSGNLIHQVRRAGYALWYYTRDYYREKKDRPHFMSVIVSLEVSTSGRYLDEYIDIITPSQVCSYIQNRPHILPDAAVKEFVGIFLQQ